MWFPEAPATLPPTDEASKDRSLVAFRDRLRAAIRHRDTAFLLRVLDPKIRTNFGGGSGIADFRKQWKLDRPGASPIWDELDTILSLGGSFQTGDRTRFWAPYVYSRWPEKWDAFTHGAIVGKNVSARRAPRMDAPVVATLRYHIVPATFGKPITDKNRVRWIPITAPGGKAAFVRARDIRSPVGWRAGFHKSGGVWHIEALISGD